MKEQIIITVGREHGSGGHYVAQLISEKLGIKLYDKEIVEGTATDNGFTKELVERMDEKPGDRLPVVDGQVVTAVATAGAPGRG